MFKIGQKGSTIHRPALSNKGFQGFSTVLKSQIRAVLSQLPVNKNLLSGEKSQTRDRFGMSNECFFALPRLYIPQTHRFIVATCYYFLSIRRKSGAKNDIRVYLKSLFNLTCRPHPIILSLVRQES